MRQDIIEDDILIALFALASKEAGTQFFKASKGDLQGIFYELKDDHLILNCFVFSEAGPEPYSPTLSDTLTDLQYGNILSWLSYQNARLFRVQDCAQDYFSNELEFTSTELDQLKKAAKDLAEKLEKAPT